MIQPTLVASGSAELGLGELPVPLPLGELLPGGGPWEVELGFGKGRYLLECARREPEARFLGVEVVSKYHGLLARRARRRGLRNVLAVRGEALYLLTCVLPRGFARAVHVYFPDPWPKARHHKRRLFDPERLDLVLGLLEPGGSLFFATDFLKYGARVKKILEGHPALDVTAHDAPWPDGARTNYEAKYVEEGRPIVRLTAVYTPEAITPNAEPRSAPLHPAGAAGILAATCPRPEED